MDKGNGGAVVLAATDQIALIVTQMVLVKKYLLF